MHSYGVFALGSSAYPNFCAFGRYMDNILDTLGAERIVLIGTGDELCGQELSFNEWCRSAFEEACEVFCLTDELDMHEVMMNATTKPFVWSKNFVKLDPIEGGDETDGHDNVGQVGQFLLLVIEKFG